MTVAVDATRQMFMSMDVPKNQGLEALELFPHVE
jgi:hypothetical protein